ncbi:RIP metalloprotease RseP [Lacticaseibacillus zhaodongensis]|uniref:RIP metalloprotease RseP n=1 Tax=Lacticaseibacillus zhaodongensis TaxID=2668065 RepID=UPI0012D302BC|nr:RIP metalloprotease RseP [Lacticaseibacillus zhaodongensis]
MTTIIWFIIIFGTIVIVHEFGHYFFAKRSGILVREFSVGMGPKLYSSRRNGTAYTLRILPLGGYVRMAGWQDEEADIKPGMQVTLATGANGKVSRINTSTKNILEGGVPVQVSNADLVDDLLIRGYANGNEDILKTYEVDHDATVIESDGTEVQIAPRDVQFQSVSVWRRMLVNFAGPMNNFILAFVVFLGLALSMGVPSPSNQIGAVSSGAPADRADMRSNDRIVAVNGVRTDSFTGIQKQIDKHKGGTLTLRIQRQSERRTIKVTPNKAGMIGIESSITRNPGIAIKYAFVEPWTMALQILAALKDLVTGGFSLNKLAGPVGIYQMTSQAASGGLYTVVGFLASLSINLGIMNLLPIPMLDGGKILMNIIEAIRRKPIPHEQEGVVTLIGAALVMALMIAVTINDILRIF